MDVVDWRALKELLRKLQGQCLSSPRTLMSFECWSAGCKWLETPGVVFRHIISKTFYYEMLKSCVLWHFLRARKIILGLFPWFKEENNINCGVVTLFFKGIFIKLPVMAYKILSTMAAAITIHVFPYGN